jgi:type I restriction enzyme S subunit
MSEWQECKLGEVCLKITDGAHNSPPTVNTGYPMASVKDMEYNKINIDSCRRISSENYNLLVKNGCKPLINDVLIAKDGSYLKHVFDVTEDVDIVLLSSIAIVRPNTKIIMPKFLKYIFKNPSFRDIVEGNFVTGAVIPRIVLKDFKNIDILLPPLPEQKAIASVLSSLDDKIDLLHRQNKTLEAMAETLFRQWFVEEADEGWEEGKLGDFFEISSGKGLKKEDFCHDGRYPVLGANGEIGRTNSFLFDEKLLFTGRVGTLGNIFIVDNEKVWLSDNTLIFKKIRYFYFIYFLLKSAGLADYNAGSTQPLIRQSDIKEIPVLVPQHEKLEIFEKQTADIFKRINLNIKQIRTLEKLRDNLLPKLMSGESSVNI